MTLIETMPVMFGRQFYPNGAPLFANQISVDGINVQDAFLRYANRKHSEMDESILLDYMLYFLHAPCFIIKDDVLKQAGKLTSVHVLKQLCLNNGLDPF